MTLSLNDIRDKARAFAKEWAEEANEHAEAKTFWDQFFAVFGVNRRRVATFETPVKKSDGHGGFIDLLWKGTLLVEHKSRGKNLDRARGQAFDYFKGLSDEDLPRYVVVSDFQNFRLYDLDDRTNGVHEFPLKDLPKKIELFGFMSGYEKKVYAEEDPVNVKAAERLGKLHDLLEAARYDGHDLEVFMVRLLFCLFADDTEIFERGSFRDYIERRTSEDGRDLGALLARLFEVLDQPEDRRQKTLDEQLSAFPHVNGELFKERIAFPDFNRKMRDALLDALKLDWSRISPAIFGSLFQSIMDKKKRRNLGAHYTTETNILKALEPLFLDELRAEFEIAKRNKKKLVDFHNKLTRIRILDPACGCGNFLVIAYRELRRLELEVLRATFGAQGALDFQASVYIKLDVDQFFGIEVEEWPAQIARVALWLVDHQMNMEVAAEFGVPFRRLPLKKSARIVHANALNIDWATVVDPSTLTYIVGNPPFIGQHLQTAEQKREQAAVLANISGNGVLDYVCNWYVKACEFMRRNASISSAFVSTSSISQGEQVGLLWTELFKYGCKINFAHRTFEWTSEAKGRAAVHCVIIGFALHDNSWKRLFYYEEPDSAPYEVRAKNINPYLVDADNVVLSNRRLPISDAPQMYWGNKPTDGGNLLFTEEEKSEFLRIEPGAKKFIRPYISGGDFIDGITRYCLWLKDASPAELKNLPSVLKRIEAVRKFRLASKAPSTQKFASYPTLFRQIAQPDSDYLAIPEVSSERRKYIPIAFVTKDVICSNTVQFIPNATAYHFGIISSAMHMAWVRSVCGRLESRFRYSSSIVYNNFVWPNSTEKQRNAIAEAASRVLKIRSEHRGTSLGVLYDPNSMPPELTKAHEALDRVVDLAYGKTFASESERVAFLFAAYQKATSPLLPTSKEMKKKGRKA